VEDKRVKESGGRHCSGTTTKGTPCQAFALADSTCCLVHDPRPSIVQLRADMAKTAGMSQKVLFPKKGELLEGNPPLPVKPINIKRARDVKKAIVRVLQEVRYGRIDPDMARTLLYGFNVLVNAIDKIEIVKRLEELERSRRLLEAQSGQGS